ncbi:MAG: CPBP family intramembrane glutamic endopeptidase [Bacteroidota bacterium]
MKTISKTNLFYVIVAVISLISAGTFYFSGAKYDSTAGIILAIFYMFIPTISVLIIEKLIYKEAIKKKLLISFRINKWFVVAWLITPVIAFVAMGIALLFPDVSFSPGMEGMFDRFESILTPDQMREMKESMEIMPFHPIWIALIQGLFAGITINAVAGFGEELGWRGFLVRRFENQKFMKAALIIGLVWGIWHSPLILMGHNYPTYPVFGVLMMIVWCILLSPLFLYITIKAKSVIAAAIMHGTLNGTIGISIMTLKGGNELMIGSTGLAGFIALSVITLLFLLYDKYISKEDIFFKNIDLK